MSEERLAAIETRHETQRDAVVTARERQDWQDVEMLLAEIARLRALRTAVVADAPADERRAALGETAP